MSTSTENEYASLVERIRRGDDAAAGELYELLHRGTRYRLYGQLGRESAEDKVHDVFLIALKAIREGRLEDPKRLLGYMKGVAQNLIRGEISLRQVSRVKLVDIDTPGLQLIAREHTQEQYEWESKLSFARQVLAELSPRDREVLVRFYLQEQTQEHIRKEMDLTETQFRLIKSRAKQRFGDLGRKSIQMSRSRAAPKAAGA